MTNKTPAIIAGLLTVILLVTLIVLSVFTQLIALNGFSERAGAIALGVSLGCQGIGLILSVMVAARLTGRFIDKNKWGSVASVLVAVAIACLLGGGISIVSIFVSLFTAEAIR
jgi:hypothetical protein